MNPILGLARMLDGILQLYLWVIFGEIIISWLPPTVDHPVLPKIKHILQGLTEPVFSFFRQTFHLDRYSIPVDLAPLAAILAIHVVRLFVGQASRGMSPISVLFGLVFSTLDFLLMIYFWIVAVAAFLAVMVCFFAYHPWAKISIPFLSKLTDPVFEFFRTLFKSDLHIRFSSYPNPLDAAPLLILLLIAVVRSLLLTLASSI